MCFHTKKDQLCFPNSLSYRGSDACIQLVACYFQGPRVYSAVVHTGHVKCNKVIVGQRTSEANEGTEVKLPPDPVYTW